jgi:ATP-binding cassette subfamily B protein
MARTITVRDWDEKLVRKAAPVVWRQLPRLAVEALGVCWRTARARFVVIVALELVSALGGAGAVLGGRTAVASVLEGTRRGRSLFELGLSFVPVALALSVQRVATTLAAVSQTRMSSLVGRQTEREILDVATAVDLASFESPAFYNLLTRATMASAQVPSMLFDVVRIIGGLLGFIAVGSVLAVLHPALLLFVVIACLPVWVADLRSARANWTVQRSLVMEQRVQGYLRSLLTGRIEAKEVRAFELAPALRRRWEELSARIIDERWRVTLASRRRTLISTAVSATMNAGVIGLILWLMSTGRTEFAAGAAAVYGVQRIKALVATALNATQSLFSDGLYLGEYREFLGLMPSPPSTTRVAPPAFARLELDHASFQYPGSHAVALNDVSVQIEAGEIVALVGENGSGKTTLAKLLAQLYLPTAGRVLWDGVDASEYEPKALRHHIAVIFQDFIRYELSARENITLGREEAGDDEARMLDASGAVGAHTFLEALDDKYDTFLGKSLRDGADLSVGQWQRVALARAFFRDAPFLILDEPTSALDPRAEHDLFKKIRALAHGRTVLLISHRFSTVRSADRIYVLDQGRVIEHGSHGELMRDQGLYAELFTMQAAAYADPAEAELPAS